MLQSRNLPVGRSIVVRLNRDQVASQMNDHVRKTPSILSNRNDWTNYTKSKKKRDASKTQI